MSQRVFFAIIHRTRPRVIVVLHCLRLGRKIMNEQILQDKFATSCRVIFPLILTCRNFCCANREMIRLP